MPIAGPDFSSILLTIGGAVLANAAIVSILAFVGKGIFNAAVSRDLESFKSDLKREGDAEIERIRSEAGRTLESYKVRLRKSEFIFERQFLAANAVIKLFSEFSPRKSNPNMDWNDAMEEVAANSYKTEMSLRAFMIEHGAALSVDARAKLESAISDANDIHMREFDDAHAAADVLHGKIEDLRNSLIAVAQDQATH